MKFPGELRLVVLSICSFFLATLLVTAQGKSDAKPTTPQPPARDQQTQPADSQNDSVNEHYSAAETFQLAGDLNSAAAEYRRAISLALQRLAAVQVLEQDNPQALVLLQSAALADPSDLTTQMALASVHVRAGDLQIAKSILQSVLDKNEHQPGAENLLGKISFMEGDYAAAAERLKAAWAENPDIDVAYSLALTYLKLNQVANAGNLFDEILTSLGSSAEVHVLIGRAYLEGGQFELAADEFRKSLKLNPAIARAHAYLGRVYLLQRSDTHLQDADREFEAELLRDHSDYSSHFYLGVSRLQQHEPRLAAAEFRKAIQLQPNSPDAYFDLGRAEVETGNTGASLTNFEKAIQLYGSGSKASQPVHEAYSAALEKVGKHDQSQRELEMARSLEDSASQSVPPAESKSGDEAPAMLTAALPKSAAQEISSQSIAGLRDVLGNAYHNMGVILARGGQYADAANFFADAAKWSPNIKALDRNWGTANFRAQRYKDAIAPLERITIADPQDLNARQMLALSYFMTDAFTKAAKAFGPILSSLPDNPSLMYAAGVSLIKSGDSKGASEIFNTMLQKNPDAPEVHLFLAQAYADLKQDPQALGEFSRALELNPKLPEANYGVGLIQLHQGNREEAEKSFRAELAVNPGNASAEYRLGYILLAKQKQGEAIDMLSDVVRQEPNDAEARYTLGKALLETGKLKPAIESLETAVHLDPSQPNSYYQLSLAYRRDGRTQDADISLRKYEQLKRERLPHSSENELGKSQ